ncbi:hypothetical protein [Streptomyces physcomitrii]|uniref:Integral membrane protein n=1 Tax=Streptomyces physcomitrii TaxID=2724184 RepID=A0ABX1H8Y9_9ACTN|nr:hypothetical protein [Streptomyces physcomitrii]NKI44807.1 hypothetical protein [Streptomyces physcomitrii]
MGTTNENTAEKDEAAATAVAEAGAKEDKVPAAREEGAKGKEEAAPAEEKAAAPADLGKKPAEDEAVVEETVVGEEIVEAEPEPAGAGVGLGAGAVVSAALGVVSLTGGWLGTVASARANLKGQIKTSQEASAADQIQAVYGDSWEATALVGGIFALVALVIGAVVLARPAFGVPRPAPAVWIRSVAWGGVVLGVIGLLLAVLKYTDVLLSLPSAP